MKYLSFLILSIFLFLSETDAGTYSLAVSQSTDLNSMRNVIKLIESQGGRIVHIFPPHILIGDIPTNIKDVNIYNGIIPLSAVENLGETAIFAVKVWNLRFEPPPIILPLKLPEPEPIRDDCLIWEPEESPITKAPPYGASFSDTSAYMIGKIAVGIILPESNGGTENWEISEETKVVNEIMSACDWWVNKEPDAYLSFTYELHKKVPTSYEPINLTQKDEDLWITQTIDTVHPNSYTKYLTKVRDYNNHLREIYQTNWAFTIYVVDSSNDDDGMFADKKYFAYAYLGGPLVVMTYKNDNYGIENMDAVTAHEIGHIFYALDEYSSSGSSADDHSGYLNIINGNFEVNGIIDDDCIMRGQIFPYSIGAVCTYTRQQIGWRDTDNDDILDIVDTFPITQLQSYVPDPTTDNTPTYNGTVKVNPYPNNNPYGTGSDITINLITDVQYRINGGSWIDCQSSDGNFDEAEEGFYFTPAALVDGTYLFEVRSSNSCATQTQVNTQPPPYSNDQLSIISPGGVVVLAPAGKETIPDSTLSYDFNISNNELVADTFNLLASSSNSWTTQIFDIANNLISSIFLNAGASATIKVQITIPPTAKIGTLDALTLTAISQTNPNIVGSSTTITTIISPVLDYIKINPATVTLEVTKIKEFTACGYDQHHNPIHGLTFNWAIDNIGHISSQIGSVTLFTAGITPGMGTISAWIGTLTATAIIKVIPGPVDYIQITPGFATIRVTESLMFYAQGYDKYHNLIPELTYNWSVIGGSILPAIGSSTLFTAGIIVCEGMIMATSSGKSAFASITITPGELHHINIFPQTQTVSILNSCSFLAKGYDMFNNYLTEISSYKWQVEQFIGSLTPQIGSMTLFTAGTKALIGTVSVTSGTITGMATITIIPGAVDYIQITPGFATLRVTESLMFYAQGYDKYHNLIPELSYNWSVIGGSILPAIGSSTLFTAGIVVCEGMIMATSSGKSAFASITITPGELHHINIFPQTQTVSILNSCSFLAKGYDMFDNYLTEISSYKWQVEQFIGSLTPQIGS
ncbi:MAG: hypothetical protein AB1422_14425, partial [bacterium]